VLSGACRQTRHSTGQEALLIVHLSSIDSFAWHFGGPASDQLATALITTIRAYGELIVVLDQCWPLTPQSGPRRAVIAALNRSACVAWFAHDEQTDDWDASMQRLGALLRRKHVAHLTLGGFEASADEATGCVNEVRRQLDAQGFRCQIDPALCGWFSKEHNCGIPQSQSR